MKKLVSLLLSVVLFLSFSVAVYAQENTKFSPRLKQVIGDYEPDEQIGIYLTFKERSVTVADMPSWPNIEQARKEHKAYREQKIAEYFEVIFETIEYEEIYVSGLAVIVSVKAQDVEKLAQYDVVQDIGYYEDTIFESYDKDSSHLFEEQYKEYVGKDSGYIYDELYYHFDAQGELDWVLVRAHIYIMSEPTENPIYRYYHMGDVVYSTCYHYAPFETEYGIYDVAKDEFLDLTKIDFGQYSDLKETVSENVNGRPIGDCDKDSRLSVLDATAIQRELALIEKIEKDYFTDSITNTAHRYADFDRDGDVSIMDATAIQRRLAKLDVPVATPDEI